MELKILIPLIGYVYNTGERVELEPNTTVTIWEDSGLSESAKVELLNYFILQEAKRLWRKGKPTEQEKLLILKQPDVYHSFYPEFRMKKPMLIEIVDGEYIGCHCWIDGIDLEPVNKILRHSIEPKNGTMSTMIIQEHEKGLWIETGLEDWGIFDLEDIDEMIKILTKIRNKK